MLSQILWALSPELVLIITTLLILGLDAIRPHQPRENEKRWIPYVALAGLVGALIATITLWGCNTRVRSPLSMLSCDAFALTIKVVALVATGLVILTSDAYIHLPPVGGTEGGHRHLPPVGGTEGGHRHLPPAGGTEGGHRHLPPVGGTEGGHRHLPPVGGTEGGPGPPPPVGGTEGGQGKFYAFLLFSTLAICLLAGATNLILIFLASALLDITAYILTGYPCHNRRSTEAAIKYFLYGVFLSAVMLYGMSWFYGLTGSTDLDGIAAALRGSENTLRPIILPALVFTMTGFAFKIGAVPFHQWAPDAHEGAPTPVTAFLSVGPMIGGFAIILRVLLTALPPDLVNLAMDWRSLLMAIATLTMTVGNLVALWQQNIKRLLAYSSIAQAGYILIGIVAASPQGVTAALLYLIAYVLSNLGALAAIIAFSDQTGSDAIEDYAGLNKRAPALALVLIISLLSLGGIPPMAGFIGKLYLFSAAIEKGLLWLAVVGVVNSVISLACYWKIIHATYILPAQTDERLTTSPALAVALGIAVIGVFAITIFADPLLALLQVAAQALFG